MNASFWHDRWKRGQIGFHEGAANRYLVKYWSALGLPQTCRIFVPFCGKTRDIAWLLDAGHRVVGAELSELAIQQLFAGLKIDPEISQIGSSTLYSGPEIKIYVGDFFDLSEVELGPVDAIYDRAALIALPANLRRRYAEHLIRATAGAPQLVVTLEYNQRLMAGPPFSIDSADLRRLYTECYELKLLERGALPEKLKGRCDAEECAWLLV